MNTIENTPITTNNIKLTPSFNIPLVLILASIPAVFLQIWLGLAIALFGLFLMFQAVIISLVFTPQALDVYRGEEKIRSFPYAEWENWEIFWQPLPILFYFKEVKSIHFLPIIFNAKTLRECLEKYGQKKSK